MKTYRKDRKIPDIMFLTNNSRKAQGLPLHRKASRGKRYKTRRECEETFEAFIEYCNR